MASERTREKIIELVNEMKNRTVENGCTPGEAAKFAAKVAQWVEEYQIQEAELRGTQNKDSEEIEICEHLFRTGKKAFNPGVTQVVNGLCEGMSCKCIMMHEGGEAVYGITGEVMDATLVCQLVSTVVPALQIMGRLDGAEHGCERGELIKWMNQYLTGAGAEIFRRLVEERKQRSAAKEAQHRTSTTALVLVTGDMLAKIKKEATEEAFKAKYPEVRFSYSRTEYDPIAYNRGREAGRRVGLHVGIEGG